MRAVLMEHQIRYDHLAAAIGLNLLYISVGSGLFLYAFQVARRHGSLLHIGE